MIQDKHRFCKLFLTKCAVPLCGVGDTAVKCSVVRFLIGGDQSTAAFTVQTDDRLHQAVGTKSREVLNVFMADEDCAVDGSLCEHALNVFLPNTALVT